METGAAHRRETQMHNAMQTEIERDVANGRYGSRFMAERDIIIAAGRIIRDADAEALQAIIRSTNESGPLWGAVVMARALQDRAAGRYGVHPDTLRKEGGL
jgi:hypothetical protein